MQVEITVDRRRVTPGPGNWIPLLADFNGRVVCQLNGDGTVFADWPSIEALCAAHPASEQTGYEVLHALLAVRDGRLAEAPRDYPVPDKMKARS